jgi:hypothetical protein
MHFSEENSVPLSDSVHLNYDLNKFGSVGYEKNEFVKEEIEDIN